MIRRALWLRWLRSAFRIPEVVRELGAQGALDNGLLEPTGNLLDFQGR
jgi:hypothetical protein